MYAALLLTVLTTTVSFAASTNRLHFPASGFSIAPLDSPLAQTPQQVIVMMLPPADGFGGNVNVQIQPYAGTLADYVTLSQEQFKAGKLTVLDQRTLGKSVAAFEYMGKLQGRSLHWYARVELFNGNIYLATATSLETQWTKEAAQLKACVDSLRCERPGAGPASQTDVKE